MILNKFKKEFIFPNILGLKTDEFGYYIWQIFLRNLVSYQILIYFTLINNNGETIFADRHKIKTG